MSLYSPKVQKNLTSALTQTGRTHPALRGQVWWPAGYAGRYAQKLKPSEPTMKANEILNKIEEYINQEQNPGAPRGTMFQNPYKKDYFKLFIIAYQSDYFGTHSSPRLTGDAIRDYLAERWAGQENEQQKNKLLNSLTSMWDEWHYALEMQTTLNN